MEITTNDIKRWMELEEIEKKRPLNDNEKKEDRIIWAKFKRFKSKKQKIEYKLNMSKKTFEEMYMSNTIEEFANKLAVSPNTIRNYATGLGLSKGKGWAKKITIIEGE